ncbi:MAG: hypothetical protein V1728_01035 [Candidatus Micrarchaeota archaeon]
MKKEAFVVLLIIVALVLLLSFSRLFGTSSEDDARKFFAEDLQESYPDADLRAINNVTRIGEGPDAYYSLKASVSSNLTTPCPERLEVDYYYPQQNFVKRAQKIVYGCKVCLNTPKCVITYPEEAIIASHTYEGSQAVGEYLAQYPHAVPNATLLDDYAGTPNVWQVDWSDPATSRFLRVLISQADNKIIGVQALSAQ